MNETNPKDVIGAEKLPLHLIPGTAKAYMSLALLEGALKYGKYNWRIAGVQSSIYLDAMERHMEKWKNGENVDPVTHVSHLASVMACCAIILDAGACGMLNDDRPPIAPAAEIIDNLAHTVAHLRHIFPDPAYQYTVEDSPWAPENNPKRTTTSTTELKKLKNKERLATRRVARLKKKVKSTKATAKK